MNRYLISATGVILTFIWIVYTAPTKQDKLEKFENEPIKKINKSGTKSLNKIRQAGEKTFEKEKLETAEFLFLSNSYKHRL